MANPTLPQVSTQGGPNPNSPGWSVSVGDLPGMVQSTGDARASMMALAQQRQAQALGVDPTMPAYDPNAAPLVAPGAAGDPTKNPANAATDTAFQGNLQAADKVDPGLMGALHNWWSNEAGSPAAQAYEAKVNATSALRGPEATTYFAAHPSLQSQLQTDPLGTAMKFGKVLEARGKGLNGTPGTVPVTTPEGTTYKTDSNAEHTAAVAAAHGVTPTQAHAMTQWHEYTPQEWLHATAGLNNKQLSQMWEMQHYLNPAQQAMALSLSTAAKNAQGTGKSSAAQAELDSQLQRAGGLAAPTMSLPTMQQAVK